jgi:AcrR family transcriptional regulator
MDDIAEETGIAKGTVYLYFRSKEEIYAAALIHGIGALHEQTTRGMRAARSLREKLHAFIAERLQYFESNQEFFRIYYSEFGSGLTRDKPIPEELRESYSRQLGLLRTALAEGMKRKEIRRLPPDLAASAIYDLTRAVIERRLLGWSKTTLDQDLEFLMSFLWSGLEPQAKNPR